MTALPFTMQSQLIEKLQNLKNNNTDHNWIEINIISEEFNFISSFTTEGDNFGQYITSEEPRSVFYHDITIFRNKKIC